MPHPKNRLKLTGDTHLPDARIDLDLDLDREEDSAASQPVYADGYVPGETPMMETADVEPMLLEPEPHGAAAVVEKVEDTAGRQAARKPWVAIGAAIGVGFLLMKMVRR